tara:strand:- start:596 stop:751 length:156 start_codon:yes stop_codon:yes gene_type:complete
MKLLVCESCEAEYKIKHNMDDTYYKALYCPFCSATIEEDWEDEIEWDEDED